MIPIKVIDSKEVGLLKVIVLPSHFTCFIIIIKKGEASNVAIIVVVYGGRSYPVS